AEPMTFSTMPITISGPINLSPIAVGSPGPLQRDRTAWRQSSWLDRLIAPDATKLRLARALCHRFHVGEALVHGVGHHLLAVHHQAKGLGDEVRVARDGAADRGLIAVWLEREGRLVAALHRLHEIDLDLDEVVWLALGERHLFLADLVVSIPGHDGAGA